MHLGGSLDDSLVCLLREEDFKLMLRGSYESTVFTLQQATKAQRGSGGVALLFL